MANKAKKSKSASMIGDREYPAIKVRGADGKVHTSRGNGDAVARALLLFLVVKDGDIKTVIERNKLDVKVPKGKNPGAVRMSVGVMLRALVRNGTPVYIGSTKVEKLSQKVELPKVEKLTAAKARPVKKAAKPKVAARPRKAKTKRVNTVLDNDTPVPASQEAA